MSIDKNNYNLLVIEDNPGDFLLVEEYISEEILEPSITHFTNFYEGWEQIKNHPPGTFDVLLLDLSLPDISKAALIEATKDITPTLPVIILTGYSDVHYASKLLAVGVSDYLLKDTITPLVLYKSIIYSKERFLFIKSLLESERKYVDLFELNPSPMFVFDAETLKFLEVNKNAVVNYGYSKEEFLTMTLRDIRPEEDMQLMHDAVSKTLGGNPTTLKETIYRHQKKDGTVFYVEIQNNVIEFNQRKAIIAIATDVTDKVSYLNSIQEQNQKLKEIAWMQSHVVRAPITRLMSLMEVIKSNHLSVSEKEEMLYQVAKTCNDIDTIIRDIVSKAERVIKEID